MFELKKPGRGIEAYADDDRVCFCFDYTAGDIRADCMQGRGQSSILRRILDQKRAGNCECAVKNPKGR